MSNDNLLTNLAALISIPSILGKPKPDAPFGESNKRALDLVLKLGRSLGFSSFNGNGYYGYIDWKGNFRENEVIGILGHLDVVPADEYKLIQKDGMLHGRGVVDNKGPVLCVLEAMSLLKQSGYAPKHTIRLIVGCNEEKGSKCIAKYKTDNKIIPKASFTPDSAFPIVISEMGILHLKASLQIKGLSKHKIAINGGESVNVVPDKCCVVIDGVAHTFKGKSAHAMCPQNGENAIYKAVSSAGTKLSDLALVLSSLPSALRLKDDSGEQTISLGIIKTTDDTVEMTFDLRCPVSQDIAGLKTKVQTAFAMIDPAVKITTVHFAPALSIDPDDIVVRSLLDAYTSATGMPSGHIKTGGGTYARALPNTIAFGPAFPDQITNIHEPNEQISLDNLFKLIDIYSMAIKNLDNNLMSHP